MYTFEPVVQELDLLPDGHSQADPVLQGSDLEPYFVAGRQDLVIGEHEPALARLGLFCYFVGLLQDDRHAKNRYTFTLGRQD